MLEKDDNGTPSKDDCPDGFIVTDVLDLHGFFPEQISEIIDAFLENGVIQKFPVLRIIHGKGRSRLKWEVHQVLKNDPRVAEYHDAPPDMGGWGATLVVLTRPVEKHNNSNNNIK